MEETQMYVSSTASGVQIGNTTSSTNVCWNDWGWERYYPTYYYPYYVKAEKTEDAYKQAFRIMKVFMKNGYFKKMTLEKYNTLIAEIAKELE